MLKGLICNTTTNQKHVMKVGLFIPYYTDQSYPKIAIAALKHL